MNMLSCLRLTARCADILISVREEIFDAGDVVGQELAAPIRKLEEYAFCVIRYCSRPLTSHH
jgi:abelson tyrosine-protein kinase 1